MQYHKNHVLQHSKSQHDVGLKPIKKNLHKNQEIISLT
jgi:hypothetical protein